MASSHRVHFFHIIWSTKGRKKLILPTIQNSLYSYFGGTIRKSGGCLIEVGGTENHVHLLLELSNLENFTTIIRNTKASSSKWLSRNLKNVATLLGKMVMGFTQ